MSSDDDSDGSFELQNSDDESFDGSDSSDDDSIWFENTYHEVKIKRGNWVDDGCKDDELFDECLEDWRAVADGCKPGAREGERTEADVQYGFRSLKQLTKIHLIKGNFPEVLATFQEVLDYIASPPEPGLEDGRTYTNKGVMRMLERVTESAMDQPLMVQFFEITAAAATKNAELAFKTRILLGEAYLAAGSLAHLQTMLQTMESEELRDVQRFELMKLKIPLLVRQGRSKEFRAEYKKAVEMSSQIVAGGKIMGLIMAEGGKMHLEDGDMMLEVDGEKKTGFQCAKVDFRRAFTAYDEMGMPERISCLKMLVLCNMLSKSDIDPFGANDTAAYKNNPAIKPMTDLVTAYQMNDLKRFMRILKDKFDVLEGDEMLAPHIPRLKRNIRTEVMMQLIRPYTVIRTEYLAREMKTPVDEVEELLVGCILDGKINGEIDQVRHLFHSERDGVGEKRVQVLGEWTSQLKSLLDAICEGNSQ